MYSKTVTGKSTKSSLAELRSALDQAEAVFIGAGAGLSASAGFAYSGPRFRQYFSDFEEKYGFHDMYTGGFTRFASPEEQWAYWSRMIFLNRYCPRPSRCTRTCANWWGTRTTSSSPPTWTTASRRPV